MHGRLDPLPLTHCSFLLAHTLFLLPSPPKFCATQRGAAWPPLYSLPNSCAPAFIAKPPTDSTHSTRNMPLQPTPNTTRPGRPGTSPAEQQRTPDAGEGRWRQRATAADGPRPPPPSGRAGSGEQPTTRTSWTGRAAERVPCRPVCSGPVPQALLQAGTVAAAVALLSFPVFRSRVTSPCLSC